MSLEIASDTNQVLCPYCNRPLDQSTGRQYAERQVGSCPSCMARYHRACWEANRGCSNAWCNLNPQSGAELRQLDNLTLIGAASQPVQASSPTADATNNEQQALARLLEEMQRENPSDARILAIWDNPSAALRDYPPAQEYLERIQLAERRTEALGTLRTSLDSDEEEQVFNAYIDQQALLEPCRDFTQDERLQVRQAVRNLSSKALVAMRGAFAYDDDARVVALYNANERLLNSLKFLLHGEGEEEASPSRTAVPDSIKPLSHEEGDRIVLAQQRMEAIHLLNEIFAYGKPHQIIDHYERNKLLLEPCRNLDFEARRRILKERYAILQQDLEVAIAKQDDTLIVECGTRAIAQGCELGPQMYVAIVTAQRTIAAVERLKAALLGNRDVDIAAAYDEELLGKHHAITPEERARVQFAKMRLECWYQLKAALSQEDVHEIARLYDPALFDGTDLLSPDEQRQCELARLQLETVNMLHESATSGDAQLLLLVYDEKADLLQTSEVLTPTDRRRIDYAQQTRLRVEALRQSITLMQPGAIVEAYQAIIRDAVRIPDDIEFDLIIDALDRLEIVTRFRAALTAPNPGRTTHKQEENIAWSGCWMLRVAPEMVSPTERERIKLAEQRAGALRRLRQALKNKNARLAVIAYQPGLFDARMPLSSEEEAHMLQLASFDLLNTTKGA